MINSLNPQDYNPYLGYKLDPGEPGLANSAPASLSILRVAAHEVGNINQFKSEAMKKGGIVIHTDIDLNLQKRGGFLAAVGGKSKAVILYKKEAEDLSEEPSSLILNEFSNPTEKTEKDEKEKVKENIEKEIQNIKKELLTENDPKKLEELLIKLQNLELAKNNSSSLASEFFLGLNLDFSA
jgi:hypothetical protein